MSVPNIGDAILVPAVYEGDFWHDEAGATAALSRIGKETRMMSPDDVVPLSVVVSLLDCLVPVINFKRLIDVPGNWDGSAMQQIRGALLPSFAEAVVNAWDSSGLTEETIERLRLVCRTEPRE